LEKYVSLPQIYDHESRLPCWIENLVLLQSSSIFEIPHRLVEKEADGKDLADIPD
jgi:hypothetical protein